MVIESVTILKHRKSGLPRFYLSGIVLDESHNRTEAGFHFLSVSKSDDSILNVL